VDTYQYLRKITKASNPRRVRRLLFGLISRYSYDANGNLITQVRHDGAAAVGDDFTYRYYSGTNRLRLVVADPSANTYRYDAIGNLTRDEQEGTNIIWNAYGKVKQVDKADGSRLTFSYDAAGNRISKTVTKDNKTTTTHYLRDASGNVMGIYQDALLEEQPLYGSSRLGSYKGGRLTGERRLGLKHYELSNHLGNVLATISDNISLSDNLQYLKYQDIFQQNGGQQPNGLQNTVIRAAPTRSKPSSREP